MHNNQMPLLEPKLKTPMFAKKKVCDFAFENCSKEVVIPPLVPQQTMMSDNNYNSSSSKSHNSIRDHNDFRKGNKVCFHRKSYTISFKRRAIEMRDSGLRIEAVAKILDTAKSNIEKWCHSKVINVL